MTRTILQISCNIYPHITRLPAFFLFLMMSCLCVGQVETSKIDKKDLCDFIETLTSTQFGGRGIDDDGQMKTQEFIVNRFKELQLEPFSADGYLQKFSLRQNSKGELFIKTDREDVIGGYETDEAFKQEEKTIETANVIGIIRGESDQAIVISAHYDHMGREESLFYPGADDNASGVAALLELSEEFSHCENLKYTMIFLATTAEERGLLGSLYHTGQPDFNPQKIICSINIDMISRCDSNHTDCEYLYCIGSNHSAMLDSLARKADELFPQCIFDYSGNNSGIFERTDAYNFKKKGVPSILFFAGFHDDYHKPSDTIEKINFDILENRIKLIGEFIKLIQKDDAPTEL